MPLRIVHLDLKGAAPKVKYLEQIFPLLASLGANGVLLEYEDMFPYEGDLKILRSPHAYSVEDIEKIKSMANLSKLELIPLVQVFGHLEFVLKHKQYAPLREVNEFPHSLNPLDQASVALVKEMVRQVLDIHPEAKWFHIGADEVYGLGKSQDSLSWLNSHNGDGGKLYLNHIVEIARFVRKMRPKTRVLQWDDMLHNINNSLLHESGVTDFTLPVIWNYKSNMDTLATEPDIKTFLICLGKLIAKYEAAGFKGVWFASAYKGTSGRGQQWTPLDHHLQNHLAWIKVMKSMTQYPSIKLQGIMLTGWQRYSHYAVLCEIFPVGIPSLAICLQSLKHGSFEVKAKKEIEFKLGCEIQVARNVCEDSGAFPGAQVYYRVWHIHTHLQKEVDAFLKRRFIREVFGRYQRKYNFADPRAIGFFKEELKILLEKWEAYINDFRVEMEDIFFSDTVEEWMEENVNTNLDLLRNLAQDADRIVKLNGQPKSLST
ncbi:hexosaminidase D [Aplochiton taeniatus]